ncbi:hypothetical protein B9057_14630 (plasmid) [Aestuarium zhoushanense]|uniref:Uncharacterized protein n=2 Tax=Rhodobacterales TaxID=204455 RepID=A0A843YIB4_9RHOB|nr:hypothetical protein [Tritonibacter litoralis]AUJ63915.1 hypothetical protein B9057_06135 [Aestuarium zhoushanense]AUJ65635.1 hypothetical protein B9057_14630 [Aestuarium zhoushanense]MCB2111726.1 hypothetical protein [Paracoccaceae bacterium]MQQ10581.1 hypothetical protein [Tritonibacter litoralis]
MGAPSEGGFRKFQNGNQPEKGKAMKTLTQITLVALALAVAGCTEPGHYSVSGEECGPNDPVLELDANDCGVPGI